MSEYSSVIPGGLRLKGAPGQPVVSIGRKRKARSSEKSSTTQRDAPASAPSGPVEKDPLQALPLISNDETSQNQHAIEAAGPPSNKKARIAFSHDVAETCGPACEGPALSSEETCSAPCSPPPSPKQAEGSPKPASPDHEASPKEASPNHGPNSSPSDDLVLELFNDERLTPAEKAFRLAMRRREQQRTNQRLKLTHRERVERLNQYLMKLPEHFDIPKVGPG